MALVHFATIYLPITAMAAEAEILVLIALWASHQIATLLKGGGLHPK